MEHVQEHCRTLALGRICEEYHKDFEKTIYMICGRWDHQGEMVRTSEDDSIASYIHELKQHIRRLETQMQGSMRDTRKLVTKNIELEDEPKATCDGYKHEISVLLERYKKLKKMKIQWNLQRKPRKR